MKEIGKPKLALGEGSEEVLFFTAFLKHMGLENVQVEEYGGKTKLRDYLKTLPLRPNFHILETVVVFRDADQDASSALQSISDSLRSAGLNVPPGHAQFSQGQPCVGVFIMPDGIKPGMIEDLCKQAVSDDPASACVDDYIDCLVRVLREQPKPPVKAWVHAWLASRREPEKRVGEAAAAGYWPWDNPAFQSLKSFLTHLA